MIKENFMHYTKDTKEYFPRGGFRGGGFRGGLGGGFPPGPPPMPPGGGGYGAGGYPWGAHGYGNRWRYNYPIGYNYPVYPSLCTEINKDPFATGMQIDCCPGLSQCFADWNNNNNPYYICKKSCDE